MESNKRIRLREDASDGKSPSLHFPVKKPSEYSSSFPSFREPTEIGCFSLDGHRRFCHDQHQLKYLVMPVRTSSVNFDLSKGYDKAIRKNQCIIEKLDSILHWILADKSKVIAAFRKNATADTERFSADFVCYRGLLTQLVCTVFENKDDWMICATKFQGTIYLCEFHTERRIERERNQTRRQLLMSSWGYKFEQYMTADRLNGKPDVETPVNENEEFCISLKGRLGNNSILFSAEVDAVDTSSDKNPETRQYVELKTSRIITAQRQDWNFRRYKLIKWWAQSFLAGIPKVICGFRDDEGIVQNVKTYHTKQIPEMAKGSWSPSVGMNFCNQFLQHVKETVVKDDPYVVYKFYWQPGQDITCEELSPSEKYQILPEWYINSLSSSQISC